MIPADYLLSCSINSYLTIIYTGRPRLTAEQEVTANLTGEELYLPYFATYEETKLYGYYEDIDMTMSGYINDETTLTAKTTTYKAFLAFGENASN